MSENFLGKAIAGVSDASYWANRVVTDIDYIRACAIAIANDTPYVLVNPQRCTSSGKLFTLPLEIPPGHTGLIAASKTSYSFRGTVGVVTYEMLNYAAPCLLQVLWHVPFDYSLYENFLNIDFGIEPASEMLLAGLYSGDQGTRVSAKDTPHSFYMFYDYVDCPRLKAEAVMGDNGRAVLAVTLKSTNA